jgi:hypothetical protein
VLTRTAEWACRSARGRGELGSGLLPTEDARGLFSWPSGAVPFRAPLIAGGDLVFGLLFLTWLFGDARRA